MQAVFRKILSATKNKLGKGADIKYKAEGGAGTSQEPTSEEFERRKQEWQVGFFSVRCVMSIWLLYECDVYIYRSVTKFWEGNVFTGVCHSVWGVGNHIHHGHRSNNMVTLL